VFGAIATSFIFGSVLAGLFVLSTGHDVSRFALRIDFPGRPSFGEGHRGTTNFPLSHDFEMSFFHFPLPARSRTLI